MEMKPEDFEGDSDCELSNEDKMRAQEEAHRIATEQIKQKQEYERTHKARHYTNLQCVAHTAGSDEMQGQRHLLCTFEHPDLGVCLVTTG
jgi:hypothetical protein